MTEHHSRQPLIIIGAARSGTKFLRNMLAASPEVRAVPYDVNYVWRYGNENVASDELPAALATPEIIRFIQTRLHTLAKGDGQVLVEKTVSNSLRVGFVDKVFPQARYLHLIRDGRAVTESSMRQWQAPPDMRQLWRKFREMPSANLGYAIRFAGNFAKGLRHKRGGGKSWGVRYDGMIEDMAHENLVEICARQWLKSVELADAALANIPSKRVFTIRYEDMVQGGQRLDQLINFVEIQDRSAVQNYHRANIEANGNNKWATRMISDDKEKMLAIIAPALARLGYQDGDPRPQAEQTDD